MEIKNVKSLLLTCLIGGAVFQSNAFVIPGITRPVRILSHSVQVNPEICVGFAASALIPFAMKPFVRGLTLSIRKHPSVYAGLVVVDSVVMLGGLWSLWKVGRIGVLGDRVQRVENFAVDAFNVYVVDAWRDRFCYKLPAEIEKRLVHAAQNGTLDLSESMRLFDLSLAQLKNLANQIKMIPHVISKFVCNFVPKSDPTKFNIFIDILKTMKDLQSLDLNRALGNMSHDQLILLANTIDSMPKLIELNLGSNMLGGKLNIFAKHFKRLVSLEIADNILYLFNNAGTSDADFRNLIEKLKMLRLKSFTIDILEVERFYDLWKYLPDLAAINIRVRDYFGGDGRFFEFENVIKNIFLVLPYVKINLRHDFDATLLSQEEIYDLQWVHGFKVEKHTNKITIRCV